MRRQHLLALELAAIHERDSETRQIEHVGEHRSGGPARGVVSERPDHRGRRFSCDIVTLRKRIRHRHGWAKSSAGHAERLEDGLAHLIRKGPSADGLNYKAGKPVTGIRV